MCESIGRCPKRKIERKNALLACIPPFKYLTCRGYRSNKANMEKGRDEGQEEEEEVEEGEEKEEEEEEEEEEEAEEEEEDDEEEEEEEE